MGGYRGEEKKHINDFIVLLNKACTRISSFFVNQGHSALKQYNSDCFIYAR